MSFVAHVKGEAWMGRYLVHLPGTFTRTEFEKHTPEVLARLSRELTAGAKSLRELLEREARREFKSSGTKVELGSLYLVGAKPMGLRSPGRMLARAAELLEETPEWVVVRLNGDPKQPVSQGGLFFGTHRFLKSQLHHFVKTTPIKP